MHRIRILLLRGRGTPCGQWELAESCGGRARGAHWVAGRNRSAACVFGLRPDSCCPRSDETLIARGGGRRCLAFTACSRDLCGVGAAGHSMIVFEGARASLVSRTRTRAPLSFFSPTRQGRAWASERAGRHGNRVGAGKEAEGRRRGDLWVVDSLGSAL